MKQAWERLASGGLESAEQHARREHAAFHNRKRELRRLRAAVEPDKSAAQRGVPERRTFAFQMRQEHDWRPRAPRPRGEVDYADDIAADDLSPPTQRVASGLRRSGMDIQPRRRRERDDAGRAKTPYARDSENFAGPADISALAGLAHARAEQAAPRVHGSGDDRRAAAAGPQDNLADEVGEESYRRKALGSAVDAADQRVDIRQVTSDDKETRHRIGGDDAGQRLQTIVFRRQHISA